MIKKLKLKFIAINMLFVTIVMIASFLIMYYNASNDIEKNSRDAMYDIAKRKPEINHSPFKPQQPHHNNYSHLTTYSIQFNKNNNTYFIEGFGEETDLTDEDIEYINNIIHLVRSSTRNEGILEEYDLRYYFTDTPDGERIILLDRSYEKDSLQRLSLSYLSGCTIAFFLFLIISMILANISVKPVEASMLKQTQLVSDVSHELKTPITIISTNTDIVLSHQDSYVKDEEKWLGYIKDETQRMSSLVNMMLYLAKTDETNTSPDFATFNVSDTVYEMSLAFESVCFESAKAFNIDVEPNLYINAVETEIKQLIAILLDNAVKYSNENGSIKISLKKSSDKAVISVFNTGEHIPKDKIPYLFDRFYRLEQSRSREKGGSGLGLSIAKRISEANQGAITVSSIKDHGTTFKCIFDLSKPKSK